MSLDEWCVEDEREWDARDPFCQCSSCAIFGLMMAEDEPEGARTCGYCKANALIKKLKTRIAELESQLAELGGVGA